MESTQEERRERIEAAKEDLSEHFEVRYAEHGQEHFHPDIGEYWLPMHVRVMGDFDDLENLEVLSEVMDEYGLEVHTVRGLSFSEGGEDGYARLVTQ